MEIDIIREEGAREVTDGPGRFLLGLKLNCDMNNIIESHLESMFMKIPNESEILFRIL